MARVLDKPSTIDVTIDEIFKYLLNLKNTENHYNRTGRETQNALAVKIKDSYTKMGIYKNTIKISEKTTQAVKWVKEKLDISKFEDGVSKKINDVTNNLQKVFEKYQEVTGKISNILGTVKNFLIELAPDDKVRLMYNQDLTSLSTWLTNSANDRNTIPLSRSNFIIYQNGKRIEKKQEYIFKSGKKLAADDMGNKISAYAEESASQGNEERKKTKDYNSLKKVINERLKLNPKTSRNYFIESLFKMGPNLYSNMYDICLRFSKRSGTSSSITPAGASYELIRFTPISKYDIRSPDTTLSSVYTSLIGENEIAISVRTASVNIPSMSNAQFDRIFLNTKVTGIQSMKTMDMQSSFNLDIDANAYFWEMFLNLSGFHRKGTYGKDNIDNNYKIMAPLVGRNPYRIDMLVAAHALHGWSTLYNSLMGKFPNITSNILFIFEDVKFMGTQSALKFGSSVTNLQSMENKFIFKQLHIMYLGTWGDTISTQQKKESVIYNDAMNNKNSEGKIQSSFYNEGTIIWPSLRR